MCLAYPEFRKKSGATYGKWATRGLLALNLLLMGIASIMYIVGSWFGPVSLSVPIVMVSKLLFNMMVMGCVLKMESFSKAQQVGTYCIAVAIATLPDIGPSDQQGQEPLALIAQPIAAVWTILLMGASISCCVGMGALEVRRKRVAMGVPDAPVASMATELGIFTTAQVCAAVVGTSVSKMLALEDDLSTRSALVGLAVFCAAINVVSLILAAAVVDQSVFVPATILGTLVVNMLTGLAVWQARPTEGPNLRHLQITVGSNLSPFTHLRVTIS